MAASYVFPKGDWMDPEIETHKYKVSFVTPKDILIVKQIPISPKQPTVGNLLIDFLKEKFPYQSIEYYDYTNSSAQPGDWKAPTLSINSTTIGWLQQNYTTFVPYSFPNARKKYKSIKLANPKFFDIFHKMAIYEFGYDPLKPGSREAYMESPIDKFEDFHPEIMKIYHSLKYKITTASSGFSSKDNIIVVNIP